MKKKTRQIPITEALAETADVWKIVAETNCDKFDIPWNDFPYGCPCCKYTAGTLSMDPLNGFSHGQCVGVCPMWEAWGWALCENRTKGTIYIKYQQTDMYDRQFFAYLIYEWAVYLFEKAWETEITIHDVLRRYKK